jgi:hypothetical protein
MNVKVSAGELNSLLAKLSPLRYRRSRFLFATAGVVCALAVTALSQWIFGSPAGVVFAIWVVFATGFFGFLAGLVAALSAIVILEFFFLSPVFGFSFDANLLRVTLGLGALAVLTHVVERQISGAIRRRTRPPIGMHGSFDGIKDGEVFGWAIDADHPTRAVPVTVFVDGRPAERVQAVYYRSDLGEKMSSAEHGFYVDLAEHFQTARETVIDVRLPNGSSLLGAPAVIQAPAVVPRRPRPTVLLMHIAKTAGTAFRDAIATNFLFSEIAYLYPNPPGFLVKDLRELWLHQLRALRLVIGHFQFGIHEFLPQKSEYITVVREPGARVLSQYRYLLQTDPELARHRNGKPISLLELFEKRLTVNFDNPMVRHFSGVGECDLPAGTVTEAVFERAVKNLRSSFRFVGHQECSSQAYEWLREHYGWHTTEHLPVTNLGKIRLEETPGQDLSAAIRHYNRWDYLLYDEILKLFPRPDRSIIRDAATQPSACSVE